MPYDRKILRKALAQYERDKQSREEKYLQRQQRLFREIPRLAEIDRELRSTASQIAVTALRRGADVQPALGEIRDRNLALQRERSAILMSRGYEPDTLAEKPFCALCGSTGFRDGAMCRCLRKYYARAQIQELSKMLDVGNASFESFEDSWYSTAPWPRMGMSPYENMKRHFATCRDYAQQFSSRSGNLLLSGDPGLGKTFLSACIARVVSENGFSVVYDTAGHIFNQMEYVKFRREEDEAAEEDVNRCMNCDLLIMDDLGTEMTTAFVQSALYQIVNSRLLSGKQTIINTNLTPEEIGRRYSPQILSRIEGEYEILPFFGEDIRRLKRQRG